MASEPEATRDQNIVRLNSIGLSLSTIGTLVGCHPTTVTNRLKDLNIEPADTRRSFMEDIAKTMNEAQLEWLADQLGPVITIKEFVRSLIIDRYISDQARIAKLQKVA